MHGAHRPTCVATIHPIPAAASAGATQGSAKAGCRHALVIDSGTRGSRDYRSEARGTVRWTRRSLALGARSDSRVGGGLRVSLPRAGVAAEIGADFPHGRTRAPRPWRQRERSSLRSTDACVADGRSLRVAGSVSGLQDAIGVGPSTGVLSYSLGPTRHRAPRVLGPVSTRRYGVVKFSSVPRAMSRDRRALSVDRFQAVRDYIDPR